LRIFRAGCISLKTIAVENWERKDHYHFFKGLDYPHFSICANLEITRFYHYIKQNNLSFFISVLYAATQTANHIPEFRYRIRGDQVIEHEMVHPSFTVMTAKGVFSFCTVNYLKDFQQFNAKTASAMKTAKDRVNLEDEPGRDDLLYITCIPWISFTNVTHPIHMNPVDSIPRIAWGKYFEEGGKIKMPLSVQGHHALIDGFHVGQYFNEVQEIMDKPERYC
jgi:chloramphenicol O-acetyltransferase type A